TSSSNRSNSTSFGASGRESPFKVDRICISVLGVPSRESRGPGVQGVDMAATPKNVAAYFLDLTMGKPDSLWTFKAGPKTAPTAYSVPTDLSMDEFYALFEEIATKIVQAHKA